MDLITFLNSEEDLAEWDVEKTKSNNREDAWNLDQIGCDPTAINGLELGEMSLFKTMKSETGKQLTPHLNSILMKKSHSDSESCFMKCLG